MGMSLSSAAHEDDLVSPIVPEQGATKSWAYDIFWSEIGIPATIRRRLNAISDMLELILKGTWCRSLIT